MLRSNMKQVFWYFSLTFLFFYFQSTLATEENAEKTGHDCESCHVNPAGGSELTNGGERIPE
jgi:hypothetical protein